MPPRRPTTIPQHLLTFAHEMRHEPSPAESILWGRLRNRNLLGIKFRRQQPLGPFIADFYSHEYQLVIEVDGDTHAEQEAYDAARTDWLVSQGYRVLRFTNTDVKNDLNVVLECILRVCLPGDEVEECDGRPSPEEPSP